MATHSSILAWEVPWTEEPGRLQSTGLQRVGHDGRDLAYDSTGNPWKFKFPIFLEEEVRQMCVGGSKIAMVFYIRIPSEHTGRAALFTLMPAQQAPHRDTLESVRLLIWLFVVHNLGFPDGSVVKNTPAMQETQVCFLGWEDTLEKEMLTHSSILASEIPWTTEPGGL